MAKEYLKINNLSNEEAGEMFSEICVNVIKQKEGDVKEMLGIPRSTPPTAKDLVSLIQECNLECQLTVIYDPNLVRVVKKEEPPNVTPPLEQAAKGSESLPF